jgi:hypothetical protein
MRPHEGEPIVAEATTRAVHSARYEPIIRATTNPLVRIALCPTPRAGVTGCDRMIRRAGQRRGCTGALTGAGW